MIVYYQKTKPPSVSEQVIIDALTNENDGIKLLNIDSEGKIGYRELGGGSSTPSVCCDYYNTTTFTGSPTANVLFTVSGQELTGGAYNLYFGTSSGSIVYQGDDDMLALVNCNLSVYFSTTITIEYFIYQNDDQTNIKAISLTGTGTQNIALTGILSLSKNDILTLRIKTNGTTELYLRIFRWSIIKI